MVCTLCGVVGESEKCDQCGGNPSLASLVKQRPDLAAGLRDVAAAHAAEGPLVAIRRLRQVTGLGLKDAKDVITGSGQVSLPPPPSSPAGADDIQTLVRQGRKLEAVKRIREQTGCGLREAKEQMETLAQRMTPQPPMTPEPRVASEPRVTPEARMSPRVAPSVGTQPHQVRPRLSETRRVGCAWLLVTVLVVLLAGRAHADGEASALLNAALTNGRAATVFVAAKVVTMDDKCPTATAVAVRDGQIIAVGSHDAVKKALEGQAYVVDETFKSKVIMPGFIDQHLHPLLGALTLAVEVIANEAWALPGRLIPACTSQQDYRARLAKAEAALKPADAWFFTWGYQPLWHGPMSRAILDQISATRPIAVWSRSCHEFYLNTAALKALGITREGCAGHGLASTQVDYDAGHFYEKGLTLMMAQLVPKLVTPERLEFGLKQMAAYEHQNGVTAYCEPGALVNPQIFALFQKILGDPNTPFYSFFIPDGRALFDQYGPSGALAAVQKTYQMSPSGKVSFLDKQVKLYCDGAIVSQLMQMKDGYLDGHQGQWIMLPDSYEQANKLFWDAGYQIHTHVNGDLGLETVVGAFERRMKENPRQGHRSVIVHFACSNEKQVERIGRLGLIVSANPYYPVGFADAFGRVGLGPVRADFLVRAGAVVRRGIPYSLHSDLPMAPSDPLFLAWCAVNRITPSGRVAAPDQRVDVTTALRGITIEAAYSWRKENVLGSITPGKIANFTVLEQDPLAVDPKRLKDIPIAATVFEGRVFPVVPRAVGARPAPAMAGASHDVSGAAGEGGECWSCQMSGVIARYCFPDKKQAGR